MHSIFYSICGVAKGFVVCVPVSVTVKQLFFSPIRVKLSSANFVFFSFSPSNRQRDGYILLENCQTSCLKSETMNLSHLGQYGSGGFIDVCLFI